MNKLLKNFFFIKSGDSRHRWHELVGILTQQKTQAPLLYVININVILKVLNNAHLTKEVIELYNTYCMEDSMPWQHFTFIAPMKAFVISNNRQALESTMKRMDKLGIDLTDSVYADAATVYISSLEKAEFYYKTAINKFGVENCQHTINAVIHSYAYNNEVEKCLFTISTAKQHNIEIKDKIKLYVQKMLQRFKNRAEVTRLADIYPQIIFSYSKSKKNSEVSLG